MFPECGRKSMESNWCVGSPSIGARSAVVPSGRVEPEEGLGREVRTSRPEEQRTSWQSWGEAVGRPLAGETQK